MVTKLQRWFFDCSDVGSDFVFYIRFLLDDGQAGKDQENVRPKSKAGFHKG